MKFFKPLLLSAALIANIHIAPLWAQPLSNVTAEGSSSASTEAEIVIAVPFTEEEASGVSSSSRSIDVEVEISIPHDTPAMTTEAPSDPPVVPANTPTLKPEDSKSKEKLPPVLEKVDATQIFPVPPRSSSPTTATETAPEEVNPQAHQPPLATTAATPKQFSWSLPKMVSSKVGIQANPNLIRKLRTLRTSSDE